jgi:long-chain acyl-CoA synthetase
VLSADGWLSTGDIGDIDSDGFVRITDRKKDLFKTSGGKYVAPSHIEGLFKGICPLSSQMIVVGANRKFCSALITLDPDAVALWAQGHGMADQAYAQIVASQAMQQRIGHYIEQLNSRLNRWETIKKWAVLPEDLSIESGEITPSLKVKRNVVHDRRAELIDSFYQD